ncbi:MAG TPA: hypothetical protein VFX61_04700, partial [Micromonosporaceae bacterium]|nr:hypothetical protein [Micromonosporaceae bacterium]
MSTMVVEDVAVAPVNQGFWTRSRKVGTGLLVVGVIAAIVFGLLATPQPARFTLSESAGGTTLEIGGVVGAVLFGLIAAAAGAALLAGLGERWFGWLLGIGVVGFVLSFLCWQISAAPAGQNFMPMVNMVRGTFLLALPLIFGALAGVLCERSGVVNVAIEGQLQRGDAAPGGPEVAAVQRLEVHGRRGVVGDHDVEDAVPQAAPERLPVGRLADRRAALERGGAVGDLLGGERQVVRAGLRGDPDTIGPGRGEKRQHLAAGHVQDVHPAAGLARQRHHRRDGLVLRVARPGRQEVPVVAAVRLRRVRDRVGVLGVHDQQPVEAGDLPHRGFQLGCVDGRELVDAGV